MIGQANRRGANAKRRTAAPTGPLTQPTYKASALNRAFSTTNVVPAITGCAVGDILLAFGGGNDQDATLTPPAGLGWTQLADSGLPVAGRMYLYATTATSADQAGGTWTWSGSHNHAVTILAYRGAVLPTAAPTAVHIGTSTTSINAPSATSTHANGLLVTGVYVVSNGNTPTWPGSMTVRAALPAAASAITAAEELLPTASASGTRTFSVGATASAALSAASVILEFTG